jgi:hypothetical protein
MPIVNLFQLQFTKQGFAFQALFVLGMKVESKKDNHGRPPRHSQCVWLAYVLVLINLVEQTTWDFFI